MSRGSTRYGHRHRSIRKQYAQVVDVYGYACAKCGEWIAPGTAWHLAHNDDDPSGMTYAGPMHSTCNAADAQAKGDAKQGLVSGSSKQPALGFFDGL